MDFEASLSDFLAEARSDVWMGLTKKGITPDLDKIMTTLDDQVRGLTTIEQLDSAYQPAVEKAISLLS